jgi:4-amino-4-deoxy-L-arabinose transferase-like glycosyltransferase
MLLETWGVKNRQALMWFSGLALVCAIAAFNVFWGLEHAERSGYYAMVATSMSQSWHNLFFGAADPAGFLALDKIPGSFWIPALLVKLIGFHNAAVVAPNGVATVLAVIFIAYAGKRLGGIWTGLFAGLLFATTPIINAVARSNEPESAFLLSMAAAAYCITVALQTQTRKHLIFAGLAIALAFQQYMIMAWAVWPALALAWWFGATNRDRLKRVLDLVIAGGTSAAASVLWILAVWLTPVTGRPYIGNTLHNNPWEMVFGYNAVGRFGNSGKMAGLHTGAISFKTFTPPFSGHPAFIRLFYHQVIGQISWLIPATLIAIVYLAIRGRHRTHLIAFSVWFVSFAVMFSAVSGMHQYYTATLAIPMVMLVAVAAYDAYHEANRPWLLAMALSSAGLSVLVGALNPGYLSWSQWTQVAVAVALAGYAYLRPNRPGYRKFGAVLMVGAMTFAPLAWSVDVKHHPSFVNPMAGPADTYTAKLAHHSRHAHAITSDSSTFTSNKGISHGKVIDWLETRPHGDILLATFGADASAPYVVLKGIRALPIGGFNGADPVPTLAQFKKLVGEHRINYVLMNHFIGDGKGYETWASAQIKQWVYSNCHKNETPPDRVTLYYCWAK